MKHKKKIMIGIGVVALFLICGIGITYSLWSKTFTQTNENTLVSDCFHIIFEEVSGSGIQLENTFPIMDQEGKKLKPYEFSIQNKCNVPVEYQINFETTNRTTLKSEYVKVMFQENEPILLSSIEKTEVTIKDGLEGYQLEKGYMSPNETLSYHLRMWMDENVTQNTEGAMNANLEGKVTIKASYLTKYVEPILNGTDPVLRNGLIPVEISDEGVVKKADVSSPWYSYEEKRWANAVILNDESITYQSGETIPESNIESYFVWIPKYRYQLWDLGNYTSLTSTTNKEQEISIIFGEYDTKDEVEGECRTPMTSGSTGNCKVGDYMTHPAFISFEVNGLWVGKFETGYKGSTDTTSAEKNVVEPESIQIKPNVNSWRSIQVSNAFYSTYDYKRELDSHMMKNTEWGAIAYLQHSKYGSMASVRINNNSDYVTGYSAVNEPTCGYTGTNIDCNKYGNTEDITKPYNTEVGYLASTTGNISGIYDMSGGAWEYMMSVLLDQKGNFFSGTNDIYNSGFNGIFGCPACNGDMSGLTSLITGQNFPTDAKYYDTYLYSKNDFQYNHRILGDAIGEFGPFATAIYGSQTRQISSWYKDESWFINAIYPWFARGGLFGLGSGSGLCSFAPDPGIGYSHDSFRVVLAIK